MVVREGLDSASLKCCVVPQMTGVIDNMQSGCDQVVVEVVVLSVPPRYVHGLRGLVTMVTFTLSSL